MKWVVNLMVLSVLTLAACIGQTDGRSHKCITNGEWRKTDTLERMITMNSSDRHTNTLWEVWMDVRHTNSYPYTNLAVCLSAPRIDTTVNLKLTDNRGAWKGNGLGYVYQSSHRVALWRSADAEKRDTLCFRLVHLMPDSLLQGVHDIGIRLVKVRFKDE